jgi:hypothetical protein
MSVTLLGKNEVIATLAKSSRIVHIANDSSITQGESSVRCLAPAGLRGDAHSSAY